jgi:multidrug resistance efflux pump
MNEPLLSNSATETTWREIEDLVEAVSRSARTESSSREFHHQLVNHAVHALAAVGGGLWVQDTRQAWRLECQLHIPPEALGPESPVDPLREQILGWVVRTRQSRGVGPRAELPQQQDAVNPTDFLWLLSPIVVQDEVIAVLEIWQRSGASPTAQNGYLRLMRVLCDLAADFHRNRELVELRQWQARGQQLANFAVSVHRGLDVEATSYAIANDARLLSECDRVSVLTCRRKRCRVRAISGTDHVDRRSHLVRSLEQLASAVVAAGEPLWSGEETDDLAPRLEAAMQDFVDQSHARSLAVIPLEQPRVLETDDRAPVGAIVAEWYQNEAPPRKARRTLEEVVRHGSLALTNAATHQSLPFFWLLRWLARVGWFVRGRQLPFTLLAASGLAAAVAVLVLVPADFHVNTRGQLQPKQRRVIFAPSDGVVDVVHVEHAEQVAADRLLVELRRPELDYEFTRVLGEIQTARQQLDSLQTARLQGQRSAADTRQGDQQLAAKEEELKEKLASLERQQAILQTQKDALQVRSPIAGYVLTWDLTQLLDARPVQRGQALMTVVDPSGDWVLKLDVPDDQIGYVLEAQERLDRALPVSFILATDPGQTYQGRIEEVAMASETRDNDRAVVRVTVRIDDTMTVRPRPGATAVGRIYCGRRPLGFVWFHDLIEVLRVHLLF